MLRVLGIVAGAWLALVPAPARGATPIRLGLLPFNDSLPVFAAMDQGYFAAEGIDPQPTSLASGTRIIEAVAGGSLDVGVAATLSVLQAVEQGLDLVVVAPAAFARTDSRPVNGLLVLQDSPIRAAGDLRGKVIAVNAIKSIGYLMVAEFLARGGVRADEVTWQELSVPQMGPALEQRHVDAVNAVEPFVTLLRDSGRARLLSAGEDVLPGVSVSALVALRAFEQASASRLRAFERAYAKGVDFCNREPGRAREILSRHTGTPRDMAQRMNIQVFRPRITAADIQPLQEAARRHRLLDRPVDPARLLPAGDGR